MDSRDTPARIDVFGPSSCSMDPSRSSATSPSRVLRINRNCSKNYSPA
jgi:hypothetical protein